MEFLKRIRERQLGRQSNRDALRAYTTESDPAKKAALYRQVRAIGDESERNAATNMDRRLAAGQAPKPGDYRRLFQRFSDGWRG